MNRSCIFCGKKGELSKEHLWPEWLGKMHDKTGLEKHARGAMTYMNKVKVRDEVRERPGRLFTVKNRVVCRTCNNGWMSKVESEAKPIILKMTDNQYCKISQEELRTVSFWVAMKVVTAEHAEKAELLEVTPSYERKLMMERREMPSYFNVYIGTHSTGQHSAWLRNSWTMALSPKGPIPPLEGRERNSQSIAFIVGSIFIYVIHIRLLGFHPENHFKFGNMKRISPSKEHFIRWPPKKKLSRVETNILAYMTQDFTESNNVAYRQEMPEG